MRKGLTTKQKRLILILAGILILLLSFFLIFQKNMETVQRLQTKNVELSGQVDFLSNLQIRVNEMKKTTGKKQQEIENYAKEYPCKITQQHIISNLYDMQVASGLELRIVKPGTEQVFFQKGQLIALSSENVEENTEAQKDTKKSAAELEPEKKVPVNQMVGKVFSYEIEISGTRKQVLQAFDWITNHQERMSLSKISLSFDSSNGKLTGTINMNFYCLNGNGVPYEEPDISGIILGNKDVFGTFKKK